MTQKELYLHTRVERIWHGVHVISVLLLILTGINLRFPGDVPIFGFEGAVRMHNLFGKILTLDFAVWILALLVTGRIRHYVPRRRRDFAHGLLKQAAFYLFGSFRKDSPPFGITEEQKFNPLQKWAYLLVMFGIIPLLVLSGVALMMPERTEGWSGGRLHTFGVGHRLLAYTVTAFLVLHIYLATLGTSARQAFRSMITGTLQNPAGEAPPEKPGEGKGEDPVASRRKAP
ncbi:MAG: cytochrome b/b6 domain-containing protein [Planctomycetota bacterium]|jgi:thiosulfate reductase cytochrome b subunit